ncbi:hypothetical protein FOCC_FOCC004906, partial [Frankliniella occidentalis]
MAAAAPSGSGPPGGPGGSGQGQGPKTQGSKSRRKISLPWFRQNSLTPGRAFLTRQHTIDTPSAFQARLLNRQPSHSQAPPSAEMTWVIADFTAASSSELTVHKGQQVEVLDAPSAERSDWCLVRMAAGSAGAPDPAQEGLVPLSVLKQPPQGLRASAAASTSPSRRLTTLPQDD